MNRNIYTQNSFTCALTPTYKTCTHMNEQKHIYTKLNHISTYTCKLTHVYEKINSQKYFHIWIYTCTQISLS